MSVIDRTGIFIYNMEILSKHSSYIKYYGSAIIFSPVTGRIKSIQTFCFEYEFLTIMK